MRHRLLTVVAVLALFGGCAGSSYMEETELVEAAPEGKALINVYRPSALGFAIKFSLWERSELVGVSTAKSVIQLAVEPGGHLLIARAENMSAVKVEAAAGSTYDLIAEVKMGGMKARVNLVPVTQDSPHREKMEDYRKLCSPITLNTETAGDLITREGIIIEQAAPKFDGGDWEKLVKYMSAEDGW